MTPSPSPRTLLETHRARLDESFPIEEKPLHGVFMLRRASGETDRLASAISPVLGLDLPETPNTLAKSAHVTAFWTRTGYWMLSVPRDNAEALRQSLETGLEGLESSLVDITHGTSVMRFSHLHARDILASGCPLDLHPQSFPGDSVAQTRWNHADILIHSLENTQDTGIFDLYVRSSFALYLWDGLFDIWEEIRE